ncbi:hypothetical protein WP50_09535 [Lactiplantibacillus plantarum]|nr:hypothetical protein WP50_09535 [Lactiplantibacillus plantarum]
MNVKTNGVAYLCGLSRLFSGVLRMMDENRPCEDVLVQLSAVKSSIDKAMKLVIARNINNCVDAITTTHLPHLEHSSELMLKTK